MNTGRYWLRLGHPAYLEARRAYFEDYLASIAKHPKTDLAVKKFEYLMALTEIAIPRDPASGSFSQGKTLGPNFRHWRRAKFLQQYRLFFRYSSKVKTIIYGWVNDTETLRAYGSKTDAYLVFRKMLQEGKVPNDWDELMAEAEKLS